jgi:hypothetical protein
MVLLKKNGCKFIFTVGTFFLNLHPCHNSPAPFCASLIKKVMNKYHCFIRCVVQGSVIVHQCCWCWHSSPEKAKEHLRWRVSNRFGVPVGSVSVWVLSV